MQTEITKTNRPNIFNYTDYRDFLRDAFAFKKQVNPAFSESAFIMSAGFGKSSRGYFGLIVKGKRNLTTKTILGFAGALKLNPQETMYFENLVHFNQAEKEEEKVFFFERMKVSAVGSKTKAIEILESQYRYVSQWYLIALREVVMLKDFKEDEAWITKKMRNKITKEEVRTGLADLLNLGLIARNDQGRLVQSEPVVTFSDNKNNFKNAIKLHQQFNDKAKELLELDPYEKRSARLTTISCKKDAFEAMRTEMKMFSDMLLKKYAGDNSSDADVVLQLGMQLFHLTE